MTIAEYFTEVGLQVQLDLRNNLTANNRNASGRTSESIEFLVSEGRDKILFQVTANSNINYLQDGRGPTQNDGPGHVKEGIRQWIKDKGIQSNLPEESLVFLISKKIHEVGYRGTPGLISGVINDDLLADMEENVLSIARNEIVRELRNVIIKS
jgi:hypothetical protein